MTERYKLRQVQIDIQMLVRESNIHNVVIATNIATARVILDSLKRILNKLSFSK